MQVNVLKKFIVFEGLDGAGTSTQSKLLSEKIDSSFLTFEPTGNDIGLLIRKVLRKEILVTPQALANLFVSDRAEHLYSPHGVVQKCSSGQVVISDRYLFSSLAYQSLELSFDEVLDINKKFPVPEVVFFLNTSINVCQDRIVNRGEDHELFEDDKMQNDILNNYLKAFDYYKQFGLNLIELDGNLPKEKLLEEELKALKELWG